MLLNELLEEFLLYAKSANRSERTLNWYQFYVPRFERFLDERGYSTNCADITPRLIREYIADLKARDSPHTLSNSVRTLKAVFNFGVKEELITIDPTRRIPAPKIPHREFEIFEPADIDTLLRACNTGTTLGKRDFAVVLLLFDSGIRASELLGIGADAIDWDRGLIRVYGKGSKERSVPVSGRTLRALRRYLNALQRNQRDDVHHLFVSARGAPLTYNALLLAMRRLGQRTGLHVHPHKFRHSFAVNALRNDAREFDIQACLGHTTLQMTRHYARQSGEDLARQHKRFSPADRLKVRV